MGKYSLVVEDTTNYTQKIIKVFDLETQETTEKVHIKDIDYMTCSYKDKYELLKDLYGKGIIDFSFGDTYIKTTYNKTVFYYQAIYNRSDVADIAMSVRQGFISNKTSEAYRNTVQQFEQLFQDYNFKNKICQTNYMNDRFKNLILRYLYTMNSFMDQEEQLNEQNYLWQSILKKISRYKTYRGIVLFVNSYQKYVQIQQYKTSGNSSNFFGNFGVSARKEFLEDTERLQRRVDDYNREYEEYLEPHEYEEAYGDNMQYCK